MFFIGFISDDKPLRHALTEQLRLNEEWQHTFFSSLDDALAAWSDALPPLIVWDAQSAPAKEDVLDFFAMRLEDKKPTPLLLVLGEVPIAIEKAGVTEKLSRPLRLGYLIARLQFYQRLLQQAPDVSWTIGPWLFEPRAHKLTLNGQEESVKITDKEVAVLEYLHAAQGPVSKDELLASIWGYETKIDTHTLETHIYRLRKKLMDQTLNKMDVFSTEDGGYQIDASWRSS